MNANSELTRIQKLQEIITASQLPSDLSEKLQLMLQQAEGALKSGNITPLESAEKYIRVIVSLPWHKETSDNLDIAHAKEIFEKHHYGMHEVKERIIDYLAVLKLKKQSVPSVSSSDTSRAPILCFVGLVGTGKTTIAYSIAEVMGRTIVRIPFGGMGSARELRGQSRQFPDAEAGHVIKSLIRAGSKNPVILLDEIDRVSEEARADIMGVLVELLDPEQNSTFTDHYIDYPIDLSQVLFVATANNTKNIATAVIDRLEPIQMPSYTDSEKTTIGKTYVFPKQLGECGLTNQQLIIDETVWPLIVRPLGFDAGVRTLERNINGICRKAARLIVEGKAKQVIITGENVKEFLPS